MSHGRAISLSIAPGQEKGAFMMNALARLLPVLLIFLGLLTALWRLVLRLKPKFPWRRRTPHPRLIEITPRRKGRAVVRVLDRGDPPTGPVIRDAPQSLLD